MRGALSCIGWIVCLAVVVRVSSCDANDPRLPSVWLNTSSSATNVRGMTFTLYGMTKQGVAFLNSSLSLQLSAVQELQPLPGNEGRCDTDTTYPDMSGDISTVLVNLNWTALCCEVIVGWDLLEPDINRSSITVRATDPLHPTFSLEMVHSNVNESVSYRVAGTNNTNMRDYFIAYSYVYLPAFSEHDPCLVGSPSMMLLSISENKKIGPTLRR